ncbi:MAG: hypothetical protein WCP39_06435 [Chlamydiota bacterium]
MPRITRANNAVVDEYVKQIAEKDFSIPPDETLRQISRLIDSSAKKAYDNFECIFKKTTEFERDLRTLKAQPRTCGKFSEEKAILTNRTSFEQMAIISEWVREEGSQMTKNHTFAFGNSEGDVVPVWIKKPRNGNPSLMTILLGSTRGNLKAPLYSKWAKEDPLKNAYQEVFVDPLNSLEMERRPGCMGSILLKSNPYQKGTLSNEWRYKVKEGKEFAKEASVELPKQKSKKTGLAREQSAGYNLTKMISQENLRKGNLLPDLKYEDYCDEGYEDEALSYVSPMKIVKTFPQALKGDETALDEIMAKLFATRLGISEIPSLKEPTTNRIFGKKD